MKHFYDTIIEQLNLLGKNPNPFHWENVQWAVESHFEGLWKILPEETRDTYRRMRSDFIETEDRELLDRLKKTNIPLEYLEKDLSKGYGYIEDLLNHDFSFITGNIKTKLLCAYIKRFYKENNILYFNSPEFQDGCENGLEMRDHFIYDLAKKTDIMVFDNIGLESPRFDGRNFVVDIIQYRWDMQKMTVCATDANINKLHWKYDSFLDKVKSKRIHSLEIEV